MIIKIGNRLVGDGNKPYFIADIGANHDGDLSRALMLIKLAREAGADAAKFQNFKASTIVSRKGFDQLGGQLSHQSDWKKSVYEVYEDASLSDDWTEPIKAKCDEVGIDYFTSTYDFDAVDKADPYVDVFKVGSGDITWTDILEHIAKKGKPVLLATGASDMEDVIRAMNTLMKWTNEIVLMQCNTNYTGAYENFNYINLNVLDKYRGMYPDIILGLSDHTHGCSTVLGAIAKGALVIEKHFTDDNSREGPDHKFALNPESWREMVERSRELYLSLGDGVKRIEENEKQTVMVQRRGLRFTRDLAVGHKITVEDVFPLRPITPDGLPPFKITELIGKELNAAVEKDTEVKLDLFNHVKG